DLGGVRQQVADPGSVFAVAIELEDGAGEREDRLVAGHAGESLSLADGIGQGLTVLLVEQRLVVEGFELGWAARLEKVDDALGAGRDVRRRENVVGLRRADRKR